MNAYTTRGQARIQQRDIAAVLRADGFLAGASLAALERQRGYQADAEVSWLLKQNGVAPHAAASLVAMLRQTIGAALVRAGERLAGGPRSGVSRKRPLSRARSVRPAERRRSRVRCWGSDRIRSGREGGPDRVPMVLNSTPPWASMQHAAARGGADGGCHRRVIPFPPRCCLRCR